MARAESRGSGQPGGAYALPELPTLIPRLEHVPSLAEKAYYLIRDRIIRLELPPGEIISERALMDELGLGRTPIREALQRLADQRLTKIAPRRGIFVAHIDIGDLASLSEVRVELEGYAGRLAAKRATSVERERAGELARALDKLHGEADQIELMELDQLVHRHIYQCTHNAYLRDTLEEYFVLSLRLWFLVLGRVERIRPAVTAHRELLGAVAEGDAAAAEAVLRAHVAGFEEEIRRVL